jgi:hypothetical protein
MVDSSQFDQRVQDLLDLPDTLLLFLSKLKKININIHRPNCPVASFRYSYDYDEGNDWGKLTKLKECESERAETTNVYRITRRQLVDLPEDEARKISRSAEVVLAFPIDHQSTPIIEQQHVFAFLPLRRVGFSVFLTPPT